jgi:outer membrane lipoprotein-sorting protein
VAVILLLVCCLLLPAFGETPSDLRVILKKMEAAYSRVKNYRMEVEVRNRGRGGNFETQRFYYTFEKPNRIRIDVESPHPGRILVYPDRNGKVAVRPFGWVRFFVIHLSPDSALLKTPSGQPVNRTDLGLLIKNISWSVTDARRGPVSVLQEKGLIEIRVLAQNHFRKGVLTGYRFSIDKTLWLPVGVQELTPEGLLERTIRFRHLKINSRIPDGFFQLKGG